MLGGRPTSPRPGRPGSVSFIHSQQVQVAAETSAQRRRAGSPNAAHWRRPLSPRGGNKQQQPMYASAERPASPEPLAARSASKPALQRLLSPTPSPADHAPDRLTALAASRADAYRHEVEELRDALARAKLHQQQQNDEHARAIAALNAELESRGRGEMLARARCEAAEVELRGARQQLTKLRETLKRDGAARSDALSTEVLDRCKHAMRSLAQHGFASSVLWWRRRALRGSLANWSAAARLIEASEVEREALGIVQQASAYARAEARAEVLDPNSPESWLRELHNGLRVRRLRNYLWGEERTEMRVALGAWRLAVCAHATKGELVGVAGRLKHAQAAIRDVLDGKTAHEESSRRTAALARVVVGTASLHGVRRDRRDRMWSLQLGFRPWLLLALGDSLNRAEAVRERLAVTRAADAHSSRRAELLNKDLQVARNNMAAAQKRMRDAEAASKLAAEASAKANEQRERAEALCKMERGKAEALEREKYALAAHAKKERHAAAMLRKGAAGGALRTLIVHGAHFRMARALHYWSAAPWASKPACGSTGHGAAWTELHAASAAEAGEDSWAAEEAEEEEEEEVYDERHDTAIWHDTDSTHLLSPTMDAPADDLSWAPIDSLPVDPAMAYALAKTPQPAVDATRGVPRSAPRPTTASSRGGRSPGRSVR